MVKKRSINLLVVILISGFVLSGCSLLSNSETPDPTSDLCFGFEEEITGNPDLVARLFRAEDNSKFEESILSYGELDGLQYGMTGLKGDTLYYGTYELCDMETGEALDKGDFVYENYTMFDVYTGPEGGSESSGSSTDFYIEVEGVKENLVSEPGNYAVYTYSSYGDDVWEVSDIIEFTVTD